MEYLFLDADLAVLQLSSYITGKMNSTTLDSEKGQLLPQQPRPIPKRKSSSRFATVAAVVVTSLLFFGGIRHHRCSHSNVLDVAKVQQCSIDNLKADLSFLDDARPIEAEEFIGRRDRLAKALAVNGIDAFVLEPGYTFQ